MNPKTKSRKWFAHQRLVKMGLAKGEQPFNVPLPKNTTPRFFIPVFSPCQVTHVLKINWKQHKTKIPLPFEKFDSYKDGFYTFRHFSWLIKIHRSHVVHREDINP